MLLHAFVYDMEEDENEGTLLPPLWSRKRVTCIPGFFVTLLASLKRHHQAGWRPLQPEVWTCLFSDLTNMLRDMAASTDTPCDLSDENESAVLTGTAKILFDPSLYLMFLKSVFLTPQQRATCLQDLIRLFDMFSSDNETLDTILTTEFLASLPAYLGNQSTQLLDYFNVSDVKSNPGAIWWLITDYPGFFRTSLDAYQTVGRKDFAGYSAWLTFITQAKRTRQRQVGWFVTIYDCLRTDLECFSSSFYTRVLMDKNLPYKEKYTLISLLSEMRDEYYDSEDAYGAQASGMDEEVKQDNNVTGLQRIDNLLRRVQRVRSVEWLITAPQYLTAEDYNTLVGDYLYSDKPAETVFARLPGDLVRFFSAMCAGIVFFGEKEKDDALNTRARTCNTILERSAPSQDGGENDDKQWDGVDPALHILIADSPFTVAQKEQLLDTVLLRSLTYLANGEKNGTPILTETLFIEKLPPQLSVRLLGKIETALENKNNTGLTAALSRKVSAWQDTMSNRVTEAPDSLGGGMCLSSSDD